MSARCHRILFMSAALFAVSTLAASAQTIHILKNDATVAGVPSTVLNTLLSGESAAAKLTATCSGRITAAEIYWASTVGGTPASLEQSITIFSDTGTAPGVPLLNGDGSNAVIATPALVDGVMNTYRHLDPPTNNQALSVPVTAGQLLWVSLALFNSGAGTIFSPGPTYDQDGCKPNRNAAFAIPGGWVDGCLAGLTGDFVIRAELTCDFPTVPAAGDAARTLMIVLIVLLGALALEPIGRRR